MSRLPRAKVCETGTMSGLRTREDQVFAAGGRMERIWDAKERRETAADGGRRKDVEVVRCAREGVEKARIEVRVDRLGCAEEVTS